VRAGHSTQATIIQRGRLDSCSGIPR
jgi:hypothetical protein